MLNKMMYIVLAFCTIMPALDWLWTAIDIQSPSKVWAYSLTTVFMIIFLALNYCAYRQQIIQERIEACAKAKKRLEETLLRKRLSSIERNK